MSVKVKICGITSPADGLVAAEAGADMIGLMFYDKSPRHISIATAKQIAHAVPPFVMKVGVFVDPDEDTVMRAIGECGLSLLQFHGSETPDFCMQFGLMSVKAFRIQNTASLAPISNYSTDAYLLDAYSKTALGGSGEQFNWDLAIDAQKFGKPIFLAGGLTPQNVTEAVRKVNPFAVDVSSGVESAPGKKDADKVKRFIAAAKS
jgi:phosphoribosylanthranilate isomerase